MPLQNRVDPFGALFASPARGTLMGNRGGKFHADDRSLTGRRWVSLWFPTAGIRKPLQHEKRVG